MPGASLSLFSPAKINLFLRIIRKRPDGYHDLASLFHTVSLGDTMSMEVLPGQAESDELTCNLPNVPVDGSNFVIKALQLFRDRSGVDKFFKVNLQKSIPAQAGMGGGSGNAATAFYGANRLCGSPASPDQLLQWADDPSIGSDPAFFLSGGAAMCTGRGEIVTPVSPIPVPDDLPVYLVKPAYGLSTGKVFKALDYSALSTADADDLLAAFQKEGITHGQWVNDLERPAFEVCPELGKLREYLSAEEHGFQAVMMSGSGTTIFCLGEPREGVAKFEASVKDRFDLEGVWRASLLPRPEAGEWYTAPEA